MLRTVQFTVGRLSLRPFSPLGYARGIAVVGSLRYTVVSLVLEFVGLWGVGVGYST